MTKMRWPALLRRQRTYLFAGRSMAALAAAGVLTGCGSMIGSMPLIGEPDYTPKPPETRPTTPYVLDSGSTRTTKPLTPEERAKLEADLAKARTEAAQDMRQQINQGSAR